MIFPIHTTNAQLQSFVSDGYVVRNLNIPWEEQKNEVVKKAKQNVIEKAGYYIRAYSKVDKNVLTDDNMYIVSSEIANISSVDIKEEVDINGVIVLHAVICATVDNKRLNEIKDKDIQGIMSKYKSLNENYKSLKSDYASIQSQIMLYNHYSDGVKFQSKQNYDEAINCYRNALSEDPNFKEAHIGIGFIHLA